MLKITCGEGVLKLEGSIAGAWVDELRRHCELALHERRQLTLDLSGVSFADGEGLCLLHELLRKRVALAGHTPFIAAQIDACNP